MVLLALLYESMAVHMLCLVFLGPKFQLFPTLVILEGFLHASWDSESCSHYALSIELFSLLPWSSSLDRAGGVSQGLELTLLENVSSTSQHWLDSQKAYRPKLFFVFGKQGNKNMLCRTLSELGSMRSVEMMRGEGVKQTYHSFDILEHASLQGCPYSAPQPDTRT